jgi:hypothetical protein
VPRATTTKYFYPNNNSAYVPPGGTLSNYGTQHHNIGSFNIPIDFNISNINYSIGNINTEYQTVPVVSGIVFISSEYDNRYTIVSGMETALIDYYTGDMNNITIFNYIQYMTGYLPISGSQDVKVDFIGANTYIGFESTSINYWTYDAEDYITNISTLYTNFSGNYDYLEDPIPVLNYYRYIPSLYNSPTSVSGVLNKIVDITLSGWVMNSIPTNIYSTILGISDGIITTITSISGGLLKNDLDITSALMYLDSFTAESMCSFMNINYLDLNLSVISGSISYINTDLWSTTINVGSILCDIGLYSLKISNFSLDIGEYISTDGFISVDITDDIFNVVTSGTYFIVDGNIVPVTFSGIDDGYRMFYDPSDNFTSISGAIEIIAHAENDNSDYLNQTYYLTYGYYLKYYNKGNNKVDLGFGKEVDVRMSAEDYASCPTNSTDAYYFYTKYFQSSDLSVSIQPIRSTTWLAYNNDLHSSIYPLSTAYFYGKVFKVTVNAKDFSGNEMPTYEFEFTIEDPTN